MIDTARIDYINVFIILVFIFKLILILIIIIYYVANETY